MRTYALDEARAEFSKLVDRALDGEPQRVTRDGKEAVVIISEVEWARRPTSTMTLADLFLKHAGEGYDDLLDRRGVIASAPITVSR